MDDIAFAPIENPDTEAFWRACREGRLSLQRCAACRTYRHPPSPVCHACLSSETEWVESNGRGKLWSFAIVRERLEGWPGEVPNVVVIVELDEKIKMISNLIGSEPDTVHIGMDVEVFFDAGERDVNLPRFRAVS